jgi:hypothetical protein
MSDAKKPTPNAGKKVAESETAAHLIAFDRHRTKLLDPLREVYERSPKAKPFDANNAWKSLRFLAYIYLRGEAEVSQKQAMMPAGDRAKLLRQLGSALRAARRKADEAMKTVRGHWFVEWAEANGNPDFTSPIVDRFEEQFDKRVAGLAVLEIAAFRAADAVRKKKGRPPGTAVLPHDFIISLESTYREITKGKSGAGPGPFARFVEQFLIALGRECTAQSVIEAIKDAKKREERHPATSRWGRSLFDGIGGKILSRSH